jgi:surface polysaccharide O-acyltransferase-like enzyme
LWSVSIDLPWGPVGLSAFAGGTWLFLFISGFLFHRLLHRYEYRPYLLTKFKNVVLPYMTVVLTATFVQAATGTLANDDVMIRTVKNLVLGYPVAGPLWFCPMIFLFYLAAPLFARLARHRGLLLAVTGLSLAFSLVMTRPPVSAGPLINIVYFASAYLFGMACSQEREGVTSWARRLAPVLVVCLMVAAAFGGFGHYPNSGVFDLFMAPERPFLDTTIIAMILFIGLMMVLLVQDSPANSLFEWLSPKSFGIFFVHGFITERLDELVGRELPVMLGVAAGIAIALLCGSLVGFLQNLLGTRSRLLIGS